MFYKYSKSYFKANNITIYQSKDALLSQSYSSLKKKSVSITAVSKNKVH